MSRTEGDLPSPVDWVLLDRYLAGECTPAELSAVASWVAADPERAAALDVLCGNRDKEDVPSWTGDQFWSGLARRLTPQDTRGVESRGQRQHIRLHWGVWLATAAGAVLMLGLIVRDAPLFTGTAKEYQTAAGQRQIVRLADGTQITLAPGSRARVAGDYGRDSRQISLEGEAYFTVVHDRRHPFAVLTHNLQINDVGTEFDVRAYDEDIRVAVARGSVVVEAGLRPSGRSPRGLPRPSFPPKDLTSFQDIPLSSSPPNTPSSFQDIPLSAGDMTEFANGVPTVTHRADIATFTAWVQGGLVFEKTPLREVVRDISRTFGVTITVADSTLLTQRITATLSNEPLDVVLDAVVRVVGARVEHTGNSVVIRREAGDNTEPGPRAPLATAEAK